MLNVLKNFSKNNNTVLQHCFKKTFRIRFFLYLNFFKSWKKTGNKNYIRWFPLDQEPTIQCVPDGFT